MGQHSAPRTPIVRTRRIPRTHSELFTVCLDSIRMGAFVIVSIVIFSATDAGVDAARHPGEVVASIVTVIRH